VVMDEEGTTDWMRTALAEMERRRERQQDYNEENGITTASIVKDIDDVLSSIYERDYVTIPAVREESEAFDTPEARLARAAELEREMREAAANLEFERAAALRDRARRLRERDLGFSGDPGG